MDYSTVLSAKVGIRTATDGKFFTPRADERDATATPRAAAHRK